MAPPEEMATDEFNILDFPDQVLLNIFQHFDQIDFLNASRVCKRFDAIAVDAFPNALNGSTKDKFFCIKIHEQDSENESAYRPYFDKFGKEMVALKIIFFGVIPLTNNWPFEVIEECCPSLTHIVIEGNVLIDLMVIARLVPNLIHLELNGVQCENALQWTSNNHPFLTTFESYYTSSFMIWDLIRLVQNNSQLKHLRMRNPLWGLADEIITSLEGKLNEFKMLDVSDGQFRAERYSAIDSNDNGLESLNVAVNGLRNYDIFKTIANKCKRVKQLRITCDQFEIDSLLRKRDEIMNAISLFNEVESLTIDRYVWKFDSIHLLMQRAPKLISLHLTQTRNVLTTNDVLFMFAEFPNLKELNIFIMKNQDSSCTQISPFDMHFYIRFLDIVRGRESQHKFKFQSHEMNKPDLFTSEKCIMNGELRHWIGYEYDRSRSQTNFSNLNEACIGKITEYLIESDVRALYATCTFAKKALANRFLVQEFEVSIEDGFLNAKNLIDMFHEHIRKLVVNMEITSPTDFDSESLMEIWRYIGECCGKTLVELTIRKGQIKPLIQLQFSFPNLEVLKLEKTDANGLYGIPLRCAKLRQLGLTSCEFGNYIEAFQPGISLGSLEVLKLSGFDLVTLKMFNGFDDEICGQVKELSLESPKNDFINPLWYADAVDTIYLFKRCPKLEVLHLMIDLGQKIRNIKEYCKHLKVINVYDYESSKCIEEIFPGVEVNIIKRQ